MEDGLVARLAEWDMRARGYDAWDYCVELEPAFIPFSFQPPTPPEVIDDGRRLGFLDLFKPDRQRPKPHIIERPSPRPYQGSDDLCELQLVLPVAFSVNPALASELLAALHNLSRPLAFELIGVGSGIVVQLACDKHDLAEVAGSIRAFFPEVKLREHPALLESQWSEIAGYGSLIDFGLSEYFFRPLRSGPLLERDPLIGIVGALGEVHEGELSLLQVLFHPAVEPWGSQLWDFASVDEEAKVLLPLLKAKFSEPALATVVRIASLASEPQRAFARARRLGNALIASTASEWNTLIPLHNEGYPDDLHEHDILQRTTHRSGMIVSRSELLSLVHLPGALVREDALERARKRTKAAPRLSVGNALVLGINEHDGQKQAVTLSGEQRLRHTYLVGASGTGKSTLLLNMICQDMEQGRGLAVLDPHGDLVDEVLGRVPASRVRDVFLIDPSDEAYPVGFNVLDAHSELERTLLSSDLVGVFRRLSTSWGDQMTSVMGNAVLAFLESTEGGTLLDLRRFLVDRSFRTRFLSTVQDQEVIYFWQHEFPLLRGTPQGPLLTRLDTFLRPKLIRYMVAQRQDKLDMRSAMDGRRIVLAKLSQGAIGEENSYLLGSLLVARINQAAASRQGMDAADRSPFLLYIDEFHNFITPSIAAILSGARKYGLGLILAHQQTQQIKSRSEEVASAVLGNAYSRVVFRVGEADARLLSEGFSFFESEDLLNLSVGEAIARIEQASFDFNLKVKAQTKIPWTQAKLTRDTIIAHSRQTFAVPRQQVEEALSQAVGKAGEPEIQPAPTPQERMAPQDVPKPASQRPVATPSSDQQKLREPGRGGPQHKYLQSLFKRAAEDRGFRATVERPVLDGHGHVDLLIEGEALSIACEISVTTDDTHEVDNISKCLAAGFDYAVLVSSEASTLAGVEARLTPSLSQEQRERVKYLSPERFFSFLDEVGAKQSSSSKQVRGYKVNVKYRAVSEQERKQKEEALADVISRSLKAMKAR